MQIVVDITGIDPAAVLWALYNDATPSPLALRASHTADMDEHLIVALYEQTTRRGDIRYFDTVGERLIKVAFFDTDGVLPKRFDATAYDDLYGQQAAQNVIDALRLDHQMRFRVMMARERIDFLVQQEKSRSLQPC